MVTVMTGCLSNIPHEKSQGYDHIFKLNVRYGVYPSIRKSIPYSHKEYLLKAPLAKTVKVAGTQAPEWEKAWRGQRTERS